MLGIPYSAALLLIAMSFGCSVAVQNTRTSEKDGAAADPAAGDKDVIDPKKGADEPVTIYALKAVADAGADLERLGMSKDSRLLLSKQGQPLHLSAKGLTSAFDVAASAWGVTNQETAAAGAIYLANMISAGWVGVFPEEVSYLDINSAALESFALPIKFSKPEELVGVAPGYLTFQTATGVYIFHYAGNEASLKQFAVPNSPLKAMGLCGQGCLLWAWDGVNFSTLSALDAGFVPVTLAMSVPQGVQLRTLAGVLEVTAGVGKFSTLFAIDDAFTLYRGGEEANAALAPTWPNVLGIAQESCMPCHNDDGFDKETVWTGLKAEMIRRVAIDTKTEVFAMPTWETKYGKELSDTKRKLIIAWLNGEAATDGGTFGQGEDPNDTIVQLTGELKTLSDNNCKSCHGNATTVNFWRARKTDAAARLLSEDMPRGNSNMNATDRARMQVLLKAL